MIRVVYDTNIVVSGLLNPEGVPALLLNLATEGFVKLVVSEEILKEYEEVLMRPKFGLSQRLVKRFLQRLRSRGKVVKAKTTLRVLKDPDDNKFLECALSGRAQWLATGNIRHFSFREFRGIKVVSPREFWEIYKESLLSSIE
ncbi:MAG: putative toxin-antitoxin system toxin component, PIN family [Ignavibacteriales bacterium]